MQNAIQLAGLLHQPCEYVYTILFAHGQRWALCASRLAIDRRTGRKHLGQ